MFSEFGLFDSISISLLNDSFNVINQAIKVVKRKKIEIQICRNIALF